MGGDRDGNPHVTAKVTRDVCYLAKWIAADLYLREVDSLRFELSVSNCDENLAQFAYEIVSKEREHEYNHDDHHERAYHRAYGRHITGADILSTSVHLPVGADIPACSDPEGVTELPVLELPIKDDIDMQTTFQAPTALPSTDSSPNSTKGDLAFQSVSVDESPASPTRTATILAAAITAGKTCSDPITKSSVDRLLNPSATGRPDIAPYRVVLGHIREKLVNTRRRMEELLDGVPCDYDPSGFFETSEELLEPLMLCHNLFWLLTAVRWCRSPLELRC